ncbi:peptidoglycan binding domain-containing protein [Thozetella sp. PMI_491]|nr:peptidoglycan binding domain-containing protein [Thozetella sp. PMI_491]
MTEPAPRSKRLIVCCDGTWLNSLGKNGGYPPSNVTRLSRVLKKTCSDGTHQIIMYHPGVGSSGSALDSITGGDFGVGLDQDIRELYNFVCSNYNDGDAVILVGFSRGAFTARSVADMIASLGLLTPDGLDRFYQIFDDYVHMGDKRRKHDEFLFPDLPSYQGEEGAARILWEEGRKHKYRSWLKQMKYTRDTWADGVTPITVKALAVWDTVGNLGVPPAPVFGVSHKVENAFQALALDEPRASFRPALWERLPGNKTNLKQVWFPGCHSNIGGGYNDQQMGNISLAWMCDQLTSVGVEFERKSMEAVFKKDLRYAAAHPYPHVPSGSSVPIPFATNAVFPAADEARNRDEKDCDWKHEHPDGTPEQLWATARPWGLGQLRYPTSWLQKMLGTADRRPGLFMRVDPESNEVTAEPLLSTEERIHSSVRVRLASGGLGLDDKALWECRALTKGPDGGPLWVLEKDVAGQLAGLSTQEDDCNAQSDLQDGAYMLEKGDGQWVWSFAGKSSSKSIHGQEVPQAKYLPEEPMTGYWERLLLSFTKGNADIWRQSEAVA